VYTSQRIYVSRYIKRDFIAPSWHVRTQTLPLSSMNRQFWNRAPTVCSISRRRGKQFDGRNTAKRLAEEIIGRHVWLHCFWTRDWYFSIKQSQQQTQKPKQLRLVEAQASDSSSEKYASRFTRAEVKRTCAHRAKVLTLRSKIGESVKKDLIDHLNSVDKTKILGTLQEIAAIKSKTSSKE
jgi:hypothetical protein